MSKELRVVSKVYNNRLVSKREECKLSQRQLADLVGDVSFAQIGELERLALSPVIARKDGKVVWRSIAIKLADFFDTTCEYLFPETVQELAGKQRVFTMQLDAEEMAAALMEHPLPIERLLDDQKLAEAVTNALSTLDKRERYILQHHLMDDDMTLDQIADEFGVSRGRVAVLEARALRKLSQPKRANLLKEFAEHSTE